MFTKLVHQDRYRNLKKLPVRWQLTVHEHAASWTLASASLANKANRAAVPSQGQPRPNGPTRSGITNWEGAASRYWASRNAPSLALALNCRIGSRYSSAEDALDCIEDVSFLKILFSSPSETTGRIARFSSLGKFPCALRRSPAWVAAQKLHPSTQLRRRVGLHIATTAFCIAEMSHALRCRDSGGSGSGNSKVADKIFSSLLTQ